MRSGVLALPANNGSTLVAWKKDDQLGWQLYDERGQASGPSETPPAPAMVLQPSSSRMEMLFCFDSCGSCAAIKTRTLRCHGTWLQAGIAIVEPDYIWFPDLFDEIVEYDGDRSFHDLFAPWIDN
ncbi:MAG: hypothetical protein U0941_30255 [Planctomycetaceae bacterium]